MCDMVVQLHFVNDGMGYWHFPGCDWFEHGSMDKSCDHAYEIQMTKRFMISSAVVLLIFTIPSRAFSYNFVQWYLYVFLVYRLHFNFAMLNIHDFTELGDSGALNFREYWLEEFLSFKLFRLSTCTGKKSFTEIYRKISYCKMITWPWPHTFKESERNDFLGPL